jgi:hypothetical protein
MANIFEAIEFLDNVIDVFEQNKVMAIHKRYLDLNAVIRVRGHELVRARRKKF